LLTVLGLEEAKKLAKEKFKELLNSYDDIDSASALGRVLFEDISSAEDVPGFSRSTVDGYAVRACDTYGSSNSIPAILECKGEILMGDKAEGALEGGDCYKISTGGMLPQGADAALMVEDSQDLGDGLIYGVKPVAPGENTALKGDDVKSGEIFLKKHTLLTAKEIGALAATGIEKVRVFKKPTVAIISTGDELIKPKEKPGPGEVRDVNGRLLAAAVTESGGVPLFLGIIKDDRLAIEGAIKEALEKADMLLISGGSSAGERDMTVDIIGSLGEVFMHGLALKPGKPTIMGAVDSKPVIGLPGHPVAAFFVYKELVETIILNMTGAKLVPRVISAKLTTNYPSNHGREEIVPVKLSDDLSFAQPLFIMSGLITLLAEADGYIKIPRDNEGFEKGKLVDIRLF